MLSLASILSSPHVQVTAAVLLVVYLVFIRRDAFGKSSLDRTQKKAQIDEMDHTNTRPATFVFLSAVQPIVVVAASVYYLDRFGDFAMIGALAIGAHVAGFALSVVTGSDMFFDLTGEVTFASLVAAEYLTIPNPSPRQELAFGLTGVWVLRLGYFLFARIVRRGGRDWRFDKLVKGRAYNAFGWVSQGTWIWLNGFCLWLLAGDSASAAAAPLRLMDWLGVAVFLAGFACECIADEQKSAWNRRNRFEHNMQTTWIQEGLWKYSRHPNFFGEMLLWVGLAILCSGGLETTELLLLAAVSPVWSCFFLVFTSLMLLEKRLDARFEGRRDYDAYKARTSVLVPWFVKED